MKIYTSEKQYENPFKSINADGMTYKQIVDSWSEPFFMKRKALSEDFYLRTPLSLIISGARGTGKTMMFKYYSFQAQAIVAEKQEKTILDYFRECKSVSMYLKFDPYILQAFSDDGTDKGVFIHFFELVVCESYIEFVNILHEKEEIDADQCILISEKIHELLGLENSGNTINALGETVEGLINEVYGYINQKRIMGGDFYAKKRYGFKDLSYRVKETLCEIVPQLRGLIFLLVIDEGENFLEFEQKEMNGFIKTLNARMNREIFLRIGTREPEIKTYETINKEEFLTIGRDYEKKDINYYTLEPDNRNDYRNWLKQIAQKRLSNCPVFSEKGLVDIRSFLGEKENLCEEAGKCAAGKDDHFRKCLKMEFSEELYEKLKVEDNPLLEMMNIWMYKKGHSIDDIKAGLRGYFNQNSEEEDREKILFYKTKFRENKVSFLYLLLSIYKKEKRYYSFSTYSYLSIGNVCNYIKLCREAFDNAFFEDKQGLFEGHISVKAQHAAAMAVAHDEIEKVKYIPRYGKELYALVVNLGNLFHEYHTDINLKNIEPNQFSIIYKNEYIEKIINTALTWGVFLKKSELQTLDSSGNKGTIYTLNKMYCPLFGISYRSKGRYREIITEEAFDLLTVIQTKKVSSVLSAAQNAGESQIPGQMSLFEGDDE